MTFSQPRCSRATNFETYSLYAIQYQLDSLASNNVSQLFGFVKNSDVEKCFGFLLQFSSFVPLNDHKKSVRIPRKRSKKIALLEFRKGHSSDFSFCVSQIFSVGHAPALPLAVACTFGARSAAVPLFSRAHGNLSTYLHAHSMNQKGVFVWL